MSEATETVEPNQSDYSELDLIQALALLADKDQQLSHLLHQIKQLQKMAFGRSSSKRTEPIDPSCMLPFPNIIELLEKVAARAEEREAQKEKDSNDGKDPGKTGKGPRSLDGDIPSGLPRLREERKLTLEQCACSCSENGKLFEVKTEVARRLEQIKIVYVDEHVTTYYACRECEKMISVAPDRENIVESGILGPSILANMVYQRFGNHTPYNRLANEYSQMNAPISRSVIGRNVLKCGELLEPIYDRLWEHLTSSFLVRVDDTRVLVRNGNEKGQSKGYVWIYHTPDGIALYDFTMSRSHTGPKARIGSFKGYIQNDAFSGHRFLFQDNYERVELGCWAHAIRGIRDAGHSNKVVAAEFDVLFALLNRVEYEAKAMSPPERFRHRVEHSRPVLSEMKDWLDVTYLTLLPKSAMGKALKYVINQWQALTNYLLDGRITDITNNPAERALRCVALGRKNWMHIGAESAGKPAAVMMSIIQTCKEQGVNAVEYLRDVLVQVSQPGSATKIDDLLPAAWKECPAAQERVASRRQATARAVESLSFGELS